MGGEFLSFITLVLKRRGGLGKKGGVIVREKKGTASSWKLLGKIIGEGGSLRQDCWSLLQ